jgi:hypothetical protein
MSCNSSIAVIRVSCKESLTPNQIYEILKRDEPTLQADRDRDGNVDYMYVDESKCTRRPRKIGGKYYVERVLDYTYEDCGDLEFSITPQELENELKGLYSIECVDESKGWKIKAYVWYNGCDEPE